MYLVVWAWPCATVTHMLSAWIIILTTVHRYIAVCKPHRAQVLCTMTNTRRQLAAVVLGVFVFNIPLFLDDRLEWVTQPDNSTLLDQVYTALGQNQVYLHLYKTALYYICVFILPVVILSVLTFLLVRELRRSSRMRAAMVNTASSASESSSGADDDLTRALLAVVVVYLCCQPWEPVRRITESVVGGRPDCPSVYFYVQVLPAIFAVVNAASNFLLFCFFGSKFRQALFEMLGCQPPQKPGHKPGANSVNAATPTSTTTLPQQAWIPHWLRDLL